MALINKDARAAIRWKQRVARTSACGDRFDTTE